MKSHITELTACDLVDMDRGHLIESFRELCNFLPGFHGAGAIESMSLTELRKLVNKARRGVQARGY